MGCEIKQITDFSQLAVLLQSLNNDPVHHIGYCGNSYEEIYQTLKDNFTSETFLAAYRDHELISAIGLDLDEEEGTAEVWGPYILSDAPDAKQSAEALWLECLRRSPEIHSFHFFPNELNERTQHFAQSVGAVNHGRYLVLQIDKNVSLGNPVKTASFETSDFSEFAKLHQYTFPSTYYSADNIAARLDETHELLLAKEKDGRLQGYVYLETAPDHGEASIEYIAVSPEYQRQGLGTSLLQSALIRIFRHPGIESVQLCVSHTNEQAIRLYLSAGFAVKDRLISYTYKR